MYFKGQNKGTFRKERNKFEKKALFGLKFP
jgi:hypothetical protein